LSACGSVYAELPAVIDHSSYPPSAEPANVSNGTSTNSLYELMGRLEQLQAEVQQLTGKVDEQAYKIDELKNIKAHCILTLMSVCRALKIRLME
jgi:hypothetical protein